MSDERNAVQTDVSFDQQAKLLNFNLRLIIIMTYN